MLLRKEGSGGHRLASRGLPWAAPALLVLLAAGVSAARTRPVIALSRIAVHKDTGARFVAFARGGSWYSSRANEIYLWRRDRPAVKYYEYVHHHLALSRDGRRLLADATVIDLATGRSRELRPVRARGPGKGRVSFHVRAAAISADLKHLVLSREFRPPRLLPRRGPGGERSYTPVGPTRPDGPERYLALYDFRSRRQRALLLDDRAALVNQVALWRQRLAAFDSAARAVIVWDRRRPRRPVAKLAFNSGTNATLRFSRDGKRLGVASVDGKIAVWDTRRWTELARWSVGKKNTRHVPHTSFDSLDFHPGTYLLATGDRRGRLEIWDYEKVDSPRVLVLKRHAAKKGIAQIDGVHFSPDGKKLVVGISAVDDRVVLYRVVR